VLRDVSAGETLSAGEIVILKMMRNVIHEKEGWLAGISQEAVHEVVTARVARVALVFTAVT
jgi:hypothetical protein